MSFSLIPLLHTGGDNKSCFQRARVRKMNLLEPDHMVYSNPIRFILDYRLLLIDCWVHIYVTSPTFILTF
jgi:hypothetical protein